MESTKNPPSSELLKGLLSARAAPHGGAEARHAGTDGEAGCHDAGSGGQLLAQGVRAEEGQRGAAGGDPEDRGRHLVTFGEDALNR